MRKYPRVLIIFVFLFSIWIGANSEPTVTKAVLANETRNERAFQIDDFTTEFTIFKSDVDESGDFTWRFPPGADEFILPISGVVLIDTSRDDLMKWLRKGSPWSLNELPVFGIRYGDEMIIAIVPWALYAELVVDESIGVKYSFPEKRHDASPCGIMVVKRKSGDPLMPAKVFREWRNKSSDTGIIPKPRPLSEKVKDLPKVKRLFGAPHFYLWGPSLFCRHDVPRNRWIAFAKALLKAPSGTIGANLVERLTEDQRKALEELSKSEWPMDYHTLNVADAINEALSYPALLGTCPDLPETEIINNNRESLAKEFSDFVNPAETWGDGMSISILNDLREAGIEHALLLLSRLTQSPRPDVAKLAEKYGYLLGNYDSYHSVHSTDAGPDSTWETAQFDREAYEKGRVINADGTGHGGFRGKGFHLSPEFAWPYVQKRVRGVISQASYSAWFIDCDATAECFDDYSPLHPATKIDDMKHRRKRLEWLENDLGLVVGSEGGSVLFADVIHFGNGVHTPYIGHLDPAFRDRESPYYLGRYWPSDTPDQSFKPVPVAPKMKSPYFDPTVRIPLYQAALGDEVICSHHWSFDSLKFSDIAGTRKLLEILYMVPPMYHINRGSWPDRKERILKHYEFWSPLHRKLAPAPLTDFEVLSKDRLLQRTTFRTDEGDVTITVNFGDKKNQGYPAYSVVVGGFAEDIIKTYDAN